MTRRYEFRIRFYNRFKNDYYEKDGYHVYSTLAESREEAIEHLQEHFKDYQNWSYEFRSATHSSQK